MRTPLAALSVALLTVSTAAPAQADTRYFSYNASDRITQALTKGITLQVRRGLSGCSRPPPVARPTWRAAAPMQPGGSCRRTPKARTSMKSSRSATGAVWPAPCVRGPTRSGWRQAAFARRAP